MTVWFSRRGDLLAPSASPDEIRNSYPAVGPRFGFRVEATLVMVLKSTTKYSMPSELESAEIFLMAFSRLSSKQTQRGPSGRFLNKPYLASSPLNTSSFRRQARSNWRMRSLPVFEKESFSSALNVMTTMQMAQAPGIPQRSPRIALSELRISSSPS